MKLLVLNWLDPLNPQSGGAEVHLREIFGRLVKRGHSVTLLCSAWRGSAPRAEVDGIEVHRIAGRHTLSLAAPAYFQRRLWRRHFDLIVEDLNKVPFFSPFWVNAPVALIVHHLFGKTAFREASLPLAAATWMLELPVSRVFRDVPTAAVSKSTEDDLVRRGMPRHRIEIIPNGIDLETLMPGPTADRFPEPTLLYLGRLKRYKRVDLILRALGLLSHRGVQCRLMIAGRGDDGPRLEKLSASLGISDRVAFLGYVPDKEKIALLRRSWLHVLTSPKEGWGIANLEAAACGTPTIASDSPGLRDSVVDGVTGVLVPHANVEVLADRMEYLLADGFLRAEMGVNARRFAEGYSWDASALSMEQFLHRRVVEVSDRW